MGTRFRGRVILGNCSPAIGALISILDCSQMNPLARVLTNTNGVWEAELAQPGHPPYYMLARWGEDSRALLCFEIKPIE